MKKTIKNILMAAAMMCGTMCLTSCDEIMETIFGEWDKPTPANSTPDPTPNPTPTPEEVNAQLVAEAQVMVEEARKEGSVISFTYTVDGVEKTAVFKRVGDGYQLQQTSGTRGDSDDELTPVLLDMDGDEDLDDDDDDPDGEPETGFENLDGADDDEDLNDDSDPSVDPDKLEWGDSEESWVEGYDGDSEIDDGGEDVDDVDADGEDEGAGNAGTRAARSSGIDISKRFMVLCFRDVNYYDHGQMILNPQTATFTAIQAVERVSYKTRADGTKSYKTIGFSGSIVVNDKLFTLQNKYGDNVAATRAKSSSKYAKGKTGKKIKITGIKLQKKYDFKKLDGGKRLNMHAQIIPKNARVKTVRWTSNKKDIIAVNQVTISDENMSTCGIITMLVGTCKLTCKATGRDKNKSWKKASYKITVKGKSASLMLTPKKLELTVGGESKQLKATVSNVAPGEPTTVTWKSSNKSVAIVTDGIVKPVGKGETTITCTTDGKGTNGKYRVTTCKVTVVDAVVPDEPKTMTVTATDYSGTYDKQAHGISLNVTEPASGYTINYRTTTDGNYNLTTNPTFTDAGTYTVYYQVTSDGYNTATGSAKVVINKANAEIKFDKASLTITYGDTAPTNTLSNSGDGTVTYSSSNKAVAEVDSSGKVTIKGAGKATIKATVSNATNYTYGDKTEASYSLTVNPQGAVSNPDDYGKGGTLF